MITLIPNNSIIPIIIRKLVKFEGLDVGDDSGGKADGDPGGKADGESEDRPNGESESRDESSEATPDGSGSTVVSIVSFLS